MAGPGGPAVGLCDRHGIDRGVAAQGGRRGPPGGADQDLRAQSGDRLLDLVLGQPVVEQCHLGAQPPGGQEHGDEAQRGRQPQGGGAARAEPGRGQSFGLLGDQGAQGVAVDGCAESEALLTPGAGQQHPVDPVGGSIGVRG